MVALTEMLAVSAIPVAFAQDRDDRQDNRQEQREERFEDNGFFFCGDRFDDDEFNDFDNGSGIGQDFDQGAESGDVD